MRKQRLIRHVILAAVMSGIRSRSIVLAIFLVSVWGCGGDTLAGPASSARKVEALSPNALVGVVGAAAAVAPAIRVVAAGTGQPLADVRVEFLPGKNGGSVARSSVVTDASGIASAGEWRFGNNPGTSLLTVLVDGVYLYSFSAILTADVPHHLRAEGPEEYVGLAGDEVGAFRIVVEDRFFNPVPSVDVVLTIVDGGGALDYGQLTTDPAGIVSVAGWRLGPAAGENRMSATVAGVASLILRARALDPAKMQWYKLTAIRAGDDEDDPALYGIADARIGFSPFDPCLCIKQQGYFFSQRSQSTVVETTYGAYSLDGSVFAASSPRFWEKGVITGDELLLHRFIDDDWGYWMTEVYRLVK